MGEPGRESEPHVRFLDQAAVKATLGGLEVSIVPASLLPPEGWLMAAALACGRGAVLSHRSGAAWAENHKAMIAPAGIPMPLSNKFISPPDGEPAIRADFYWPEQRAVTHQQIHTEPNRLNALIWKMLGRAP